MSERLPLLYILSSGRSGSTLLDLLMGAHPNLWSVGELQILPWELEEHRAPCGCGQHLNVCSFWNGVLKDLGEAGVDLEAGPLPLRHFRNAHGFGQVLRKEHLRSLWRGRLTGAQAGLAQSYGQLNRAVLDTVARHAAPLRPGGIEWLVDASKDPYRLAYLAESGQFDLRVVHLVKDPRAFVHSMTRADERLEKSRVMRFGLRWGVENRLMRRYLEQGLAPEQWRAVRYEDLAGDPAGTLEELFGWLGVDAQFPAHEAFREADNHAVSGNQMRWQSGGVRLDQKWRKQLPGWAQAAAWNLSAPVRAGLGFGHDPVGEFAGAGGQRSAA